MTLSFQRITKVKAVIVLSFRWLHRVIIYDVSRASVYVLNAVFTFLYTASLFKLITCNKQWLNSVKILGFSRIITAQTKVIFLFFIFYFFLFIYFLWLYLWFSWISFGEIFQKSSLHVASCGIRILKTKKVGFLPIYVLPLWKNVSYRFPWKTSSDLSEIFTTGLPHFTEFHRRNLEGIPCQFWFLCSCWRQKISKSTDVFLRARADYLSFRPQRACDRKTIGGHLKQSNIWARDYLNS